MRIFHSHFVRLLLAVAALLNLGAARSQAAEGIVVTQETETPLQEKTTKTTSVTDTAIRVDEGDTVTVITTEGGQVKMYSLTLSEKTVSDMSSIAPMMLMGVMFFIEQSADGTPRLKQDALKPTAETGRIGKWNASKATMTIMGMEASGWYTKESPQLIEYDLKRMKIYASIYEQFMQLHAESTPQKTKEAIKETSKALVAFANQTAKDFGAEVSRETNMGVKTTTQVVSVEKKNLPDEMFRVPAGYKTEASADGAFTGGKTQ